MLQQTPERSKQIICTELSAPVAPETTRGIVVPKLGTNTIFHLLGVLKKCAIATWRVEYTRYHLLGHAAQIYVEIVKLVVVWRVRCTIFTVMFSPSLPRPFLQSPPPMSYDKYLEHIDTTMGADTPIAFGLHPNAEIDFRTQQSDTMFKVRKYNTATVDGCCSKQYLPMNRVSS